MLKDLQYSNIHLYGHYKVGNNIYYNKMDALSDHIKTSNNITWHLFEEEFDKFDLTQEPTESIEELYAKRARELREKYDYLILHFSGGTDSGKIVDIFYRNGLKIDEIFSRSYSEGERKKAYESGNDPEAIEPELLTKPQLDFIKNNLWPDVTIRQLDITDTIIKSLGKKGEWFKNKKIPSTEGGVAWRSDWDEAVPEWRALTDRGLKIGHIIGKEKTHILKDQTGYYFIFSDKTIYNWIMPRDKYVGYPQYNELFFWHPSCAKMILKQAHMLKHQSTTYPILLNEKYMWSRPWENKIADILYGDIVLKRPIEPLKSADCLTETSNRQLTTCTNWWVTNSYGSDFHKSYIAGLHAIYSEIKPIYNNFLDFYNKGMPFYKTKKHYIAYHA